MYERTCSLVLAIAAACGLVAGCRSYLPRPNVRFVDHAAAHDAEGPMALVITIDAGGRLTLNQIETGTITTPAVLNEKLQAIFEDRRRSSITTNDLLIETIGPVAFDDVDRLIDSLKAVGPSRITVVTK